MTDYKQVNEPYSNDIFAAKLKFGSSGCFAVSLSNMVGIYPPDVAQRLRDGGGFDKDGLVISDKSAQILGLDYFGKSQTQPPYPCIAETDYWKKTTPQHFFIINPDGSQIDPLGKNIKYPIVSYRLFKVREESMDIHEWDINLVRSARQNCFGHVDDVGAEADGKLLDEKFNSGDQYEAGNLITRYFESDEFNSMWIKKSDCATLVATEVMNATRGLFTKERLAEKIAETTKGLIRPEDCPKCEVPVVTTEKTCFGFIDWFKNLFKRKK